MGRKKKYIGCKVPGCEGKHFGKGYCHKHYLQIRTHGKIRPDRVMYTSCKVPGCGNMHKSKVYCSKHYFQMRKYGEIKPGRVIHIGCKVPGCTGKHCSNGYCQKHHRQMRSKGVIGDRICSIGCKNEHFGKGYCAKHYHQMKKYGKIRPDKIIHANCEVPGCIGKHLSKGYCAKHYAQVLKYGSLRLEHERKPNEIIIKGGNAEVIVKDKSKKRQVKVVIDAEDAKKVHKHYWFVSSNKIKSAVKKEIFTLPRFIMGFPERQVVLYKNGNPLDCRNRILLSAQDNRR